MGVSQLFQFRRLFRRRHRVVDGNRHFVIGHDKSMSTAKTNPNTTHQFPKGSHFIVEYDRNQLSANELDICNNNDDGHENIGVNRAVLQQQQQQSHYLNDSNSHAVVFAVLPGGESSSSSQHFNFAGTSNPATAAVLPTTELKEVNLFSQQ